MSTVIIIGGSARAHAAIDNANSDASTYNWTQAEREDMTAIFDNFVKNVDAKRAQFNPA